MGRNAQPFKLSPAERTALDAARLEYLAWHEGLAPVNPAELAALRKASKAMAKALLPLLDSSANQTASRLLVRMQEAERFQSSQEHYSRTLTEFYAAATLIDRACGTEVRPGVKARERTTWWIQAAAAQWRAAGLPVAARGRFLVALTQYDAPGVPNVTDAGQVTAALQTP